MGEKWQKLKNKKNLQLRPHFHLLRKLYSITLRNNSDTFLDTFIRKLTSRAFSQIDLFYMHHDLASQNISSNSTKFESPNLKTVIFTHFLLFFLSQALKNLVKPHNYTHGWKALFDAKILVPGFRGLEVVINALDFLQHIGQEVLFFRWSLSYLVDFLDKKKQQAVALSSLLH